MPIGLTDQSGEFCNGVAILGRIGNVHQPFGLLGFILRPNLDAQAFHNDDAS